MSSLMSLKSTVWKYFTCYENFDQMPLKFYLPKSFWTSLMALGGAVKAGQGVYGFRSENGSKQSQNFDEIYVTKAV